MVRILRPGNWRVEFHRRKSGRCPIEEFLAELSGKDKVLIIIAIERLAKYGIALGRPYVGYLEKRIF
jgi:hypothetical protein